MKRHAMVMADPDRDYLMAFTSYVDTALQGLSMEVAGLHSLVQLGRALEKENVSLAVVSETFLPEAEPLMREAAAAGRTMMVLTEGIHKSPCEAIPAVNKYQPVPSLMHKVMRTYAAGEGKADKPVIKEDMAVIGVYSPAGRCLKSSLALTIGQVLAARCPTLLLDFEGQAAYSGWFDRAYARDLSDLAVAVLEKKPRLISFIASLVQHVGALSFIPPFMAGHEVPTVPAEVWTGLIEQIRENSAYEALIADIGNSIQGIDRILSLCDRIVVPVNSADPGAEAKVEEFFKTMDLLELEIKNEPVLVDISGLPLCGLGSEAPGKLPDGPLGEIAADLIRGLLETKQMDERTFL